MKKIKFTKMVASGNDFILVDSLTRCFVVSWKKLAKEICDRKFGVGADGLLVLEKSKRADLRMRIFNADGSEAEMCGNGARCVAFLAKSKIPACPAGRKNHPPSPRLRGIVLRSSKSEGGQKSKILKLETKAGIIESKVEDSQVKIKLTDPKDLKLDLPIKINNRTIKVNFINTGVPHAVIFSYGLDKIDVFALGRLIRKHQKFSPAGTNVDFVEIVNDDTIKVRTYERGVEDETLACGTGAVAAALIANCKLQIANCNPINVQTRSKEILKVYFQRNKDRFSDVWLEGKAKKVYQGEYYV